VFLVASLFIWREWCSRARLKCLLRNLRMAADRTGDRMGNRTSRDGPLPGPAMIRDLNWTALNWAAHCSFLPGSSSPLCTPVFAPPESVRASISHPERESSERPVCEDFERPGRNSSARLEFGRGEHPDSERRHFRRNLRRGVSAQPGKEARGLREVRRTPRRRKGKRPEREVHSLPEKEKALPEKELRHSRRREVVRPDSGVCSHGAEGSQSEDYGEPHLSGHPAGPG
jgi:hypothetical protein